MYRSIIRRNVTLIDILIIVIIIVEGCFWELDEGIILEFVVFIVEEVERVICFDFVLIELNLKAVLIRLFVIVIVIEGVVVIILFVRWFEYGVVNCKGEIEGF